MDEHPRAHLSDRLERRLWADGERLKQCKSSLDSLLDDPSELKRFLVPIAAGGDAAEGFECSLAHAVLSTPSLQAAAAKSLLELIPEAEQNCDEGFPGPSEILSQFRFDPSSLAPSLLLLFVQYTNGMIVQSRWVETVRDPEALAGTLMEVMEGCGRKLQSEMLSFVPELTSPAQHHRAVSTCLRLVNDDHSLLPAALECLDSLDLSESLRRKAIDAVLRLLPSLPEPDLGKAARLLLQGATSLDSAHSVVDALRSAFRCRYRPSEPDNGKGKVEEAGGKGSALVEALATSLRLNQLARRAYLGRLKSDPEQEADGASTPALVPLDAWVLFCMAEPGTPTPVAKEAAIAAKKRARNPADLREALRQHPGSLKTHRGGIVRLAGWLTTTAGGASAEELYCQVFCRSETFGERDEVLSELVSRVLSGGAREAIVAAKSLSRLAEADPEALTSHRSAVSTLLESCEGLRPELREPILHSFSVVAMGELRQASNEGAVQGDLHKLLQKGLPSTRPSRRGVGVQTAVALLSSLHLAPRQKAESLAESVISLMSTLCYNHPDLTAAVADRLSLALMSPDVPKWLVEKLWDMLECRFENECMLDDEEEDASLRAQGAGSKTVLNLEAGGMENCVKAGLDPASMGEHVKGAPALMRVSVALSLAKEGSASEVEAALGCPLLIAQPALAASSQSVGAREAWLSSATLAVSWLRECVNSFALPASRGELSDNEPMRKVLARARQSAQMEALVEACSHGCTSQGRQFRPEALVALDYAVSLPGLSEWLSAAAPLVRAAWLLSERGDEGVLERLMPHVPTLSTAASRAASWLASEAGEEAGNEPEGSEELALLSLTSQEAVTSLLDLASGCRAVALRSLRLILASSEGTANKSQLIGQGSRRRSSDHGSADDEHGRHRKVKRVLHRLRQVCDNMLAGGAYDAPSAADAVCAMEGAAEAVGGNELSQAAAEAAGSFLEAFPGKETRAPPWTAKPEQGGGAAEGVTGGRRRRAAQAERSRAVRELVSAHVRMCERPLERVRELSEEHMAVMGEEREGSMQALGKETAAGWGWALHRELQRRVKGEAGKMKAKGPLPGKEEVEGMLGRAEEAGRAFAGLMEAAKGLRGRKDTVGQALREGAKELELMGCFFPLWGAALKGEGEAVARVERAVNAVKRGLDVVLSGVEEARSRRELANAVPKAKRAAERFVTRVAQLRLDAEKQGILSQWRLSNRKHFDLAGSPLPSQLRAGSLQEEDEGDDEDEEPLDNNDDGSPSLPECA